MTKSWLIGTTALLLLAGSSWAADSAAPATEHEDYIPYDKLTLEQARDHAHKHAEKLDKMTPEEWEKHKADVKERQAKWKAMTPEEREKHKEEMRAKHHHNASSDSAPAASPGAATPAPEGK